MREYTLQIDDEELRHLQVAVKEHKQAYLREQWKNCELVPALHTYFVADSIERKLRVLAR